SASALDARKIQMCRHYSQDFSQFRATHPSRRSHLCLFRRTSLNALSVVNVVSSLDIFAGTNTPGQCAWAVFSPFDVSIEEPPHASLSIPQIPDPA
ncbi:MAG: hypothetical protein KDB23_13165, partial [Planctomycetales bacterium]|nr:hypothetical protein [Planctomycetales bacterium]